MGLSGLLNLTQKEHGVIVTLYSTTQGQEVESRALIKELKKDGWELVRVNGSHHHFRHPTKPGTVTVPHPKKDLKTGLVRGIRKSAGLL
ncbi:MULTISPECIES: type II toxin-antitoxin system HicA family toxin [unclassified Halomonas]|uniref:type II toxin-antitoxin system HicA family toxin n=1 Tax=unclassified Halomonas TaxID=2609666 RepID=UPI001CF60FEF|nr:MULTISPECIES: type II toxin-antitoxin system HicA family toxin [unclassified Halomonas]